MVCSRGLHWDWVPPGPNPNLAGAGGLNFAAGGNRWLKHTLQESSNAVEKKLKQGLYNRKNKQGKSDIWKSFSIV